MAEISLNVVGNKYSSISSAQWSMDKSGKDAVAWYKFDNNYDDSSGNNNTLTNYSCRFNSTDFKTYNGSIEFTGSSYLEIANDGRFSPDSFTITGWGKLPPASDIVICASCRSGTVQNGYGWTIAIDTVRHNKIRFSTRNVLSVAVVVCYSTTDFCSSPAKWNHFAFSYSSILKKVVIYINGVLDSTYDNIEYSANTTTNLRIGAGIDEGNPSFYLQNGSLMDDFRIYNRVLSQDEVSILYNNGNGTNLPLGNISYNKVKLYSNEIQVPRNMYYVNYMFENSQKLLTDNSDNNRSLTTLGNYELNDGKNSLLLTNQDATLPTANWSTFNDLTISGWFKTSTLVNDEKLLEFSYNEQIDPAFVNDTSSLIVWYKFNQDTTNMLLDSSGNNNSLTNVNCTFNNIDFKTFNGSIAFTGSSYLQVTNDGRFSPDNFTISCWCKIVQPAANTYATIASCRIGATPSGWIIYIYNNNLEFWTGTGSVWSGGSAILFSSFATNPTVWRHLVITMNKAASTAVIYINGALISTVSRTYVNNIATSLRIGAGANETSPALYLPNGSLLDDFRIYNRVLSPNEVSSLYLNTASVYVYNDTTNMLAWYKFDNNWDTSATSIATYNLTNDATNPVSQVNNMCSAIFDNTNDFLSNSEINLNNTSYSIAFWVRLTGLTNNSTQMFIVTQGNTNATRNLLHIGWVSNTWYFALWGDDCISSTMDYTTVNNTWVHLVFTFDYISGGNNVFKIFMNGTLIGSKNTTSGNTNFATGTWRIGKPASTYGGFTGYLADFRLYNRVLTVDEINTIIYIYSYTDIVHPFALQDSQPIAIGGQKGEYYIAFTSTSNPYSITCTRDTVCSILVVGGGGGGSGRIGGGGGGGAVLHIPNAILPTGTYNISIGDGGISYSGGGSENGQNTTITGNNISIIAQGGGGTFGGHDTANGKVGGSGGGAAGPNSALNQGGATGTGSSLGGLFGYIYGNRGGNITTARVGNPTAGTGGGGAGSAAVNINPSTATGHGGAGILINITGNNYYWGGGGGGAGYSAVGGNGGIGGGGGGAGTGVTAFSVGGSSALNSGNNGQAVGAGDGDATGGKGGDNTGGGGGGGGWDNGIGGKGGSGIVILRYSTNFTKQEKNILIKKINNTDLSFQINNTPIYTSPSWTNNDWTYILWNITNNTLQQGFVKINNGAKQTYTKIPLGNSTYINKLCPVNANSVYISDFKIVTVPLTTEIENHLYDPATNKLINTYNSIVDNTYVKNSLLNLTKLHAGGYKKLETISSGISITGNLLASGTIVQNSSDMRLKTVSGDIINPVSKIMNISAFKYTPSALAKQLYQADDTIQIGVSAQEVQQVLPEVVSENQEGFLTISYSRMVPLLVEAIKQLKIELDELSRDC